MLKNSQQQEKDTVLGENIAEILQAGIQESRFVGFIRIDCCAKFSSGTTLHIFQGKCPISNDEVHTHI